MPWSLAEALTVKNNITYAKYSLIIKSGAIPLSWDLEGNDQKVFYLS